MNLNNYQQIKKILPNNVQLIVVSKRQEVEKIQTLYNAGQRVFGENRPIELRDKATRLPKDIKWHYIGPLQTNKIKYVISFVDMIHSVGSVKLFKEIDKQAKKNNRVVDVLLQFHLAKEETKQGFQIEELTDFLQSDDYKECKNVCVKGVMTMATFTDDKAIVRKEFRQLKKIFDELKENYFKDVTEFKELSMGMSNDSQIAIEEGSTMVRIGTAIFKE